MGFIIIIISIIIVVGYFIKQDLDKKEYEEIMSSYDKASSYSTSDTTSLITMSENDSYSSSGLFSTTTDGGYIINPESSFPLTIYGVDEATIKELINKLDNNESITYIVSGTNLRCKEIDDYVEKFKPHYLKKIEKLKDSSKEWAGAYGKYREDLLIKFRDQAIKTLEIIPSADLDVLFEYEDFTINDDLIDQYGSENLRLYFRYANRFDNVIVISTNHYQQDGFEQLVEVGLAIRGLDIELSDIWSYLKTLSLKEMNALVSDIIEKPFSRKNKAVEFLITVPDIKTRLSKIIALHKLFQLSKLPNEFVGIDLGEIHKTWMYENSIANLISNTYASSISAISSAAFDKEIDCAWEILTMDDDITCKYCKDAALKSYPSNKYPLVPLHIGCRCTVVCK
ncbi:MAG: hypothetical protein HY809_00075 [Nitrospirae bacterium]|nr:hypothetical protein [Nitrospirota bacterium]